MIPEMQGEVQKCMISYISKLFISTVYAQGSKKKFHFDFSELFSLLLSSVLNTRMKWYTKYTGCNVQPFKTSLEKYILILTRHKVLSSYASFTKGLETALLSIAFYA